jgi:hypothetical protein
MTISTQRCPPCPPVSIPPVYKCPGPCQAYLMTIDSLEKNAVAKLGLINEMSYDEFEQKMFEIAKKAGIVKPLLVTEIEQNIGIMRYTIVTKKLPYLITKEAWSTFNENVKTYKFTPRIFVVDGSKCIIIPVNK